MPEAIEIAPGIWVSEGFSNAFCLPTDEGRLVVNTGMFFEAPVHKRNFDAVDARPIRTIVLTQGHVDHVGGVDHLRGPETVVIAHEHNAAHQADDERIARYRMDKSAFAFGASVMDGIRAVIDEFGALPAQTVPVPDVTFRDRYDVTLGDRRIELHHVPGGETEDSLVVWLPDEKVALVGNFFSALIGHIPNLVTMRGDRLRDPLAFVASVDRILALEPEVVLPGHHGAVEGADLIREELTRIRDATQWVHDETVAGMNAGNDPVGADGRDHACHPSWRWARATGRCPGTCAPSGSCTPAGSNTSPPPSCTEVRGARSTPTWSSWPEAPTRSPAERPSCWPAMIRWGPSTWPRSRCPSSRTTPAPVPRC